MKTPITDEVIKTHPQIVDNLVLLGWERDELVEILLSPVPFLFPFFFRNLMS